MSNLQNALAMALKDASTREALRQSSMEAIAKKNTLGLGEIVRTKVVTTTEVKPVGGEASLPPLYRRGTPMNNIYVELKKDAETYLSSEVEEYRNIAESLANELIPNFLQQVDSTFNQRAMAVRMTQEGLKKFKEEIAQELLPKFKSDFKAEAKKRIGAIKPKETPKETTTTTTTTTESTKTEVSDTTPKSDNDKMILYGGIALVVIAIIMSK